MRNLKIVINKDTEPKVIKVNQQAIITLAFNTRTDDFNNDTGYNDLYVSIADGETKQFEQDNLNLIGRCIHKMNEDPAAGFTAYLIWCDNYTIMN